MTTLRWWLVTVEDDGSISRAEWLNGAADDCNEAFSEASRGGTHVRLQAGSITDAIHRAPVKLAQIDYDLD